MRKRQKILCGFNRSNTKTSVYLSLRTTIVLARDREDVTTSAKNTKRGNLEWLPCFKSNTILIQALKRIGKNCSYICYKL